MSITRLLKLHKYENKQLSNIPTTRDWDRIVHSDIPSQWSNKSFLQQLSLSIKFHDDREKIASFFITIHNCIKELLQININHFTPDEYHVIQLLQTVYPIEIVRIKRDYMVAYKTIKRAELTNVYDNSKK